jgi:hypothetical protein
MVFAPVVVNVVGNVAVHVPGVVLVPGVGVAHVTAGASGALAPVTLKVTVPVGATPPLLVPAIVAVRVTLPPPGGSEVTVGVSVVVVACPPAATVRVIGGVEGPEPE